MSDYQHLDTMDHAELASKTRELLGVLKSGTYLHGACCTNLWNAVEALQPSPLDKLRQTLREQGWTNENYDSESFVCIIRNGNKAERWSHNAH